MDKIRSFVAKYWKHVAITVLAILAAVGLFTNCGTFRIHPSESYAQLQSHPGKEGKADVGRAWCAKESYYHGNVSGSLNAIGGVLALIAFAMSLCSVIFPNEKPATNQHETWRYRGFLAVAGSVAFGFLAYLSFDRSTLHTQTAAKMQSGIKENDDIKAYGACIQAVADLYASRVQFNSLVVAQLSKQQEDMQKTLTKASESEALSSEFVAEQHALTASVHELQLANSSKTQGQVDSATQRVAVASARLELAKAKLQQLRLPEDAPDETKATSKASVDQLALKVIQAEAASAGITATAPAKPVSSAMSPADAGKGK